MGEGDFWCSCCEYNFHRYKISSVNEEAMIVISKERNVVIGTRTVPSTDSHQPSVNGFEMVLFTVEALWVELVAVKHLDLSVVPSRSDHLLSIAQPDLDVSHVVALLFT